MKKFLLSVLLVAMALFAIQASVSGLIPFVGGAVIGAGMRLEGKSFWGHLVSFSCCLLLLSLYGLFVHSIVWLTSGGGEFWETFWGTLWVIVGCSITGYLVGFIVQGLRQQRTEQGGHMSYRESI